MELDLALWRERYRTYLVPRLRPPTVERYVRALGPLFAFLGRHAVKSLAAVTAEHLEGYRQHLFARKHRGRTLAHATVSLYLQGVKSFTRFLVRERYLLVNVAAELELPRSPRKLPRVLSEEEVERLLLGVDLARPLGVRDRAILELLYGSGLRNAELRALRVEHLDPAQRLLIVAEGKGGKSRVVPLGEESLAWLEEYLATVRPRLGAAAATPWLFLTRRGTRFAHNENIATVVARAARRAGLTQPVTPHILRHCCATHMLARGAGLRQLQVFLGHASSVTTQHYTTVEVSALRRVLLRCHPRERRR